MTRALFFMSTPRVAAAVALFKAHVDTFTRTDGTVVQAHDTKVQAGWKKDAEDPVSVHVPPVGAKVQGSGIHGRGTVHSVSGNMVAVAHRDSGGGAQLTDHHASKLQPHTPGEVSGAAATHDRMADKHLAASVRASRADDAKGELAHDKAASAHEAAYKAHLAGHPSARGLTEKALAATESAENHFPLEKFKPKA